MNLIATAPLWLIAFLAVLVIAAGIEDAARFRISNVLSLSVLLAGIVAIALSRMPYTLWQNTVVFAALLAAGTALFGTGKFGGGDVKLLAALGVWVNFRGALPLLASIFIAGGIFALLVIAARRIAPASAGQRIAILKRGGGIPYGVAIAAGSLFYIAMQRL